MKPKNVKFPNNLWFNLLMGITFALIWSSAFTSARIIVQETPPLTISALRFLLAGTFAVLIAKIFGQSWHLTRKQWQATGILGLCQNTLYLGLFFIGMQWIEASLAVIIASTLPLLVGLFNRCFFGTLIQPLGLLGLIIGFLGVSIIMIDRFNGNADLRGVIACSAGVIAFTFATISVRNAASSGNVLMIVGLQMIIGGVTLALISLLIESWTINWSIKVFFAFAYTTIVPGLIATWIWFKLLDRIGTTRASTFHFLNPFFGILIATNILDEALSLNDYIGAAIISIGILAVQISKLKQS